MDIVEFLSNRHNIEWGITIRLNTKTATFEYGRLRRGSGTELEISKTDCTFPVIGLFHGHPRNAERGNSWNYM